MSDHRLPDGTIPVLLSSDTDDSLRREGAAVLAYCEQHPDLGPAPVADMLLRTRVARRHRALIMVTDRADLLAALRAVAEGTSHPKLVRGTAIPRKIGYVYPGQGSQRPGMGRMLYQHSAAFRAAVDEAEAVFQDLYDISPLAYLLHEDGELEDDVRIVQPALFMQMIGLSAMWRAVGVTPTATVGHSQGEIAAAVVSGLIPLADGVRVVTIRAQLVGTVSQEAGIAGAYSMAVLGVDRDQCEALLARNSGWAELSVVNSAHILAISGERAMITETVDTLTGMGVFAKEIKVAYPAHTSIVSKFRDILCGSMVGQLDRPVFAETAVPSFGGALGKAITPDLPTGDYWYWNLRNRVRFDLAIAAAAEHGVDTLLEIADHPTLMLAVQENLATLAPQRDYLVTGTSRRTATDLAEFTRSIAQIAVSNTDFDWDGLLVDGPRTTRLPLFDFPNTQTNDKHLWAPHDYTGKTAQLPAEPEPVAVPRITEQWVHLPRRSLVPPRALAVVDVAGTHGELVEALRAGAPRHGATIVDHEHGTSSAGTVYDTIAVLLPAVEDGVDTAVTELAAFLGERSWLPDTTGVKDIWLVTVGGEQVVDGDLPGLFPAAAQAGFRCLAAEYPGVAFRHLDLPADVGDRAKLILGAVHTAGEPELAVRESNWYGKRLVADESVVSGLSDADLGEVVIVGGTGKLGLDFCAEFARAGAGRITLISRSGGSADALARIAEIAAGGTQVRVLTADVTDPDAVRALAAELGEVDLLVHAAVDYAASAEPSPESIRAAAAPKIVALDHLVTLLPRGPRGRVLLCSSLSATVGGRGHAVYSAVNRMLDAAAARYRAEGIAASSVQWGLWRAVGADQDDALAAISGTGLRAMDPAGAVAAGITTVAENVIVVAADWPRVTEVFTAFGLGALFADLKVPESVVEVTPEPVVVAAPVAETPTPTAEVDTAERVRFALREVMGLDATEPIDGAVPLVALGLDSLQALDLRKRVENELRLELPVTAIMGGASLDEVVGLLRA
ncbi:nocobactin polyketide synthase NbtC [Nocardia sp. AG03]|uniref:nocobactin polyketide synthase NbtC n=1 Tax=Nocardia sp. AG03 TaxID=3025312 RepID=UPI00241866B2|nr:nocobactin polyketide synthase NbtC [Nocardia sp. AG03]